MTRDLVLCRVRPDNLGQVGSLDLLNPHGSRVDTVHCNIAEGSDEVGISKT